MLRSPSSAVVAHAAAAGGWPTSIHPTTNNNHVARMNRGRPVVLKTRRTNWTALTPRDGVWRIVWGAATEEQKVSRREEVTTVRR